MEHPSQETEQRSTLVPVWILVILGLVMATAVGMLYFGASAVGATWDERIHAVMLGEYFTSGWYASPDWLVNGAPGTFLGKWPYFVYAPVAELITQGFAVLTGAEPWKGFSESPAAYTARHLATGLIALLGILGTACSMSRTYQSEPATRSPRSRSSLSAEPTTPDPGVRRH